MNKNIIVKVVAHTVIPLSDIRPFQGDLKKLSKTNFNKLRGEILEDGFNFAPHLWKCDKWFYILDGHQRIYVLSQLLNQGYNLVTPEGEVLSGIPANLIHAEDINEAKRKVLQSISTYGKVDKQGFDDFTLDIDFQLENFDIPDIKLDISDVKEEKDLDIDLDDKEYNVLIELTDETEQSALYEELKERGFQCKLI